MNKCECQVPAFQEFTIDSEFYNSLPNNHVIRTLMEEHQVILKFCKELEKLVNSIRKKQSINESQNLLNDLRMISGHFMRMERHHIREEFTLLRRLFNIAEYGPAQEIRRQHDELGIIKRNLERATYEVYITSFDEFKKDLLSTSGKLVKKIKEHIDIEDDVLYPQAIKLIPAESQWMKIREESDNIGYCCFTPGK